MITLYFIPGTAALAPHMALEEAGAAYELVRLQRDEKGNVTDPPDYREVNPQGRIPALRWDGRLLTEAAAMVMHVSDAFPEAGLVPEPGSWERAEWYRWLCFLTNTVQDANLRFFQAHRFGTPEAEAGIEAKAASDLLELRAFCDAELGDGPYVLGERFSSADLFLAMMTRWGRRHEHPWWDATNLGAHYQRIKARPAIVRVYEQEGLDDDVY